MKLTDFDYHLPPELIAQRPLENRDQSRLLVLDKQSGQIQHEQFTSIAAYLKKGDVLVLNNSKVFPARLLGERQGTGGKVEVFLHKIITNPDSRDARAGSEWQCLVGARRVRVGLVVEFGEGLVGQVLANNEDGTWQVSFNKGKTEMMKLLERIGIVPLPPYIKRPDQSAGQGTTGQDRERYQTVYADEAKVGSVAAPTAGLHFTPALLAQIKARGVQIEYITLHVGLGTFAPVKVEEVTTHKMHAEFVEIKESTLDHIAKAKQAGGRVVAVGTTSVRSLESFYTNPASYEQTGESHSAWVDIFIYPGYEFKVVDAMVTNFHLPKSTLLMLVSAFASRAIIRQAYSEAVERQYRFFSYGDAMLIT